MEAGKFEIGTEVFCFVNTYGIPVFGWVIKSTKFSIEVHIGKSRGPIYIRKRNILSAAKYGETCRDIDWCDVELPSWRGHDRL